MNFNPIKLIRSGGIFLALGFALVSPKSASAQVIKAELHTANISCGACAAISEINLRRLDGVEKVDISRSRERVVIFFKPGARFQPADIKDALQNINVKILSYQITARGNVTEKNGKRLFVTGKNTFALVNSSQLPIGSPISVEGVVDVSTNPMQLMVTPAATARQ